MNSCRKSETCWECVKHGSFSNCGEISPELEKPYKFVSEKKKKLPRDTVNKNLNLLNKGTQRHLSSNIWSNSEGRKGYVFITEMGMLFRFVVKATDVRQSGLWFRIKAFSFRRSILNTAEIIYSHTLTVFTNLMPMKLENLGVRRLKKKFRWQIEIS